MPKSDQTLPVMRVAYRACLRLALGHGYACAGGQRPVGGGPRSEHAVFKKRTYGLTTTVDTSAGHSLGCYTRANDQNGNRMGDES